MYIRCVRILFIFTVIFIVACSSPKEKEVAQVEKETVETQPELEQTKNVDFEEEDAPAFKMKVANKS